MGSNSCGLIHQAVVPGSSSGVYYIPVSNLHPSMTFSDLRSVARTVASIEKCFIYPNVAEGWVRVRGHANFEKAQKHLDGYNYNGYIISASGQNEKENVYIWDARKSPHGIGSTCSYAPVQGVGSGSSDDGDGHLKAGSASPTTIYGGTYFAGYDGVGAVDAVYTNSHPHPAFSPAGPYTPYYYYTDDSSVPALPHTVKIIVKNLSRHASHRELDAFLTKAAGGKHKLQESVRFPRSAADRSSFASSTPNTSDTPDTPTRQHAFLVFTNHDDARAALDWLHRAKLKGLSVEARFVSETVLPLVDFDTDPDTNMDGHCDAAPTPMPETVHAAHAHSPALTVASCSSGQSAQSDGSQSHNLVVDGSSAYGRAKKAAESKRKRK